MSETKKVAWNASEGLIIEISKRRSMANSFFISNKFKQSMNTLIAIKQSVIQSFDKAEREKLNKIEEKFSKISPGLSSSFSNSFDNNKNKVFLMAQRVAKKIYSEYNDLLMDLLDERGYLIGEQSDGSKMKF